jgi:hypothetical protein
VSWIEVSCCSFISTLSMPLTNTKRSSPFPPLKRREKLNCIPSLARAELYLTLATVFRGYEDQELFESSRLDVDIAHDYLLPQPDARSKGVKVLFK